MKDTPAKQLEDAFRAAYKPHDTSRVGDPTIHVSNLINFCPRTYFLCKKDDRSLHSNQYFGIQTKYDFDIGHAVQRIQVERLATVDQIFGRWRCSGCGWMEVGFPPSNGGQHVCPKCQCPAWGHVDLRVEIPIPLKTKPKSQIIIVGHIDYVFATHAMGFVTDAKSISADYFDKLTTPNIEYRRQVQLYMWMVHHARKIVPGHRRKDRRLAISAKKAIISYGVKGSRKMPLKQFDVEQDPKFIAGVEKDLKALAKAIETNKVPKKICNSQHNMMAKQCPARDICFDQQLPSMKG